MNLRGRLYGIGATLRGRRWRARLQQIEACEPDDIRRRALPLLLKHALAHVPYYRNLGVSVPQLEAFPLLTRETLRTQYERLASDDLESRLWRKTSTGGSTGEPVWILLDRAFSDWDLATEMYTLKTFHNMSPFEYLSSRRLWIWHLRRVQFSSNPLLRLASRVLGQIAYVEPYEILTEEKLNEHVRRINAHRAAVISAFAGTAFEIAKHAQRLGVAMHRPRFITTSVEMLYPAMRETIQAAFGCPVYNHYGAAETGKIASECPHGKLHVFSFTQHVEVLDDEDLPTRPGEVGRIVVTPLHNLAMPLIRYDIGDFARVSAGPCGCGSPLPAWDEIIGRVVHYFVRPDGDLVFGGNFIAMFYEYDWILQLHVLQEDIDRFKISYRRTPDTRVPEQDIDDLTKVVRDVMGESCAVTWEQVDVIPHSPIGKHLHARSLVWEEKKSRITRPGETGGCVEGG
ncbi:phenylacetate--CoA ligase family protein [Candidatus Bipolaricaulota bacterium]